MRQLRFSILFFVSIMLLGISAGAQNTQSEPNSDPNKMGLDPTVEIITDYQGRIMDADKIDVPYSDDDLLSMKSSFTYQVLPLTLSNDFNMRPIPPAGLQIQTDSKESKTGYFRGGMGYPLTPDFNLYLHGQLLEHSAVNLYINHLSFWGKVPLYKDAPQTTDPIPSEILGNNAKTRAGVTLQHFWKKTAIDVRVEYRNRYVLYHGHDTLFLKRSASTGYINTVIMDDNYVKDKLAQMFHTVKSTFNFYSFTDKNRNTNFNIGGLYEYVNKAGQTNSPSVSQSLMGLNLQLNQKTNTGQAIDLSLRTRAADSFTDNALSNVVTNFVPAYQYNSSRVSLTAGVNLEGVYNNEKFSVNVYPNVDFSYKIIGTYFTPYLSANGGTTINNYEKIIDENPYVLPDLNVVNTRTLDLNGGIRGSISSRLAYQLNVGYTIIDSAYFYTNSIERFFSDQDVVNTVNLLRNNFDVHYDNLRRLSFELGLNTEIENFEAIVKAKYSQYDMSNAESKPWHLPDIEAALSLRYTLLGKLIFNVNGTYHGEVPVWLSSEYPESSTLIPAYINLGAMVEYRIDDKISFYIQGTNLLNDNYQQYYLYYNPGITFGAGLSIVF